MQEFVGKQQNFCFYPEGSGALRVEAEKAKVEAKAKEGLRGRN